MQAYQTGPSIHLLAQPFQVSERRMATSSIGVNNDGIGGIED
jgi:hypothetical protein